MADQLKFKDPASGGVFTATEAEIAHAQLLFDLASPRRGVKDHPFARWTAPTQRHFLGMVRADVGGTL